ncbi:MAG: hypothetical protein ACYCPS_06515 [Candidatus Saccharimonadales bacterium]
MHSDTVTHVQRARCAGQVHDSDSGYAVFWDVDKVPAAIACLLQHQCRLSKFPKSAFHVNHSQSEFALDGEGLHISAQSTEGKQNQLFAHSLPQFLRKRVSEGAMA